VAFFRFAALPAVDADYFCGFVVEQVVDVPEQSFLFPKMPFYSQL
jgi:hypothetical protein